MIALSVAFLMLTVSLLPLGPLTITVYHAVPEQTDSSPLVTADGTKLTKQIIENSNYCAVSQDLLRRVNYGDALLIPGKGVWWVHDTMHAGVRGYVDLLVPVGVMGKWENVKVYHLSGKEYRVRQRLMEE